MAEIVQVKNQKLKSCGFPTELSRFLNNHSPERLPAILTTIVARRGSAPRSVGTKMLVLQDGTIIGTIGGGCMESAVVRRALEMIMTATRLPFFITETLQVRTPKMTAWSAAGSGYFDGACLIMMDHSLND